jgi:hypothetical protein
LILLIRAVAHGKTTFDELLIGNRKKTDYFEEIATSGIRSAEY